MWKYIIYFYKKINHNFKFKKRSYMCKCNKIYNSIIKKYLKIKTDYLD